MNSISAFRIIIEFPPEEYTKQLLWRKLVTYRGYQLRHSQHNSSLVKNVSAKGLSVEKGRLMQVFALCVDEGIPVIIYVTDFQGQRISMDAFQFTHEGTPIRFTSGLIGIFSFPTSEVPMCIGWKQIIEHRDTYRTLQLLKESS